MRLLRSFTHPHVVPNLNDDRMKFLSELSFEAPLVCIVISDLFCIWRRGSRFLLWFTTSLYRAQRRKQVLSCLKKNLSKKIMTIIHFYHNLQKASTKMLYSVTIGLFQCGMVFLHSLSKKLVCLWSMCIHTPMRSHLNHEICVRNIMTTFFLVSSYPINDWKLWLICFNETSIMNCSLINHNNPVLRALPFIQATAEVILHNYSKFLVFERGLWKRPIVYIPKNLVKHI